ncbi:putative lipase [Golovinomyces cichoracearum]|uniref:sn-1-specific diacylglycerol lipase n=1 Tax=Golovinomyces cichoracearum TaxID=62708 RepID=A0A420INF5_9PEZI|nr:putative lipase [Golovinomyces cichoracearum]
MALDNKDDKTKGTKMHTIHNSSVTLLPPSIANTVSLITRSSSLYLRLGAFVGRLALHGARNTTLSGLELCRAMMENILIRAGREVADRTNGGLGETEAEGILERNLIKLHSNITNISFAVSTGFYISSAAIDSANSMSRLLLSTLDSIFGSTDSSKAIACIITLIRREFQNPATGRDGEKVGVTDLFVGACGLALLQHWCSRMTNAKYNSTEIVWDVIVLNNGKRVDIMDDNGLALVKANPTIFMSASRDLQRRLPTDREKSSREIQDEDFSEMMLKERILKELPPNTSISVHTKTNITKLITVIVTSAEPPNISLPPGVEIFEECNHIKSNEHERDGVTTEKGTIQPTPRYRVTYRVRNEIRNNIDPTFNINYDAMSKNDESHSNTGLFFSQGLTADSGKFKEKSRPNTADGFEGQLPYSHSSDNVANQKRYRKPANSSPTFSFGQTSTRKLASHSPNMTSRYEDTHHKKTWVIEDWLNGKQPKGSTPALYGDRSRESDASILSEQTRRFSSYSSSYFPTLLDLVSSSPKDTSPIPRRESTTCSSPRDLSIPNYSESMSRPGPCYMPSRKRNTVISESELSSSPTNFTDLRTQRLLRARSEKQIASCTSRKSLPIRHKRSKSHVPNVYSRPNNISGNQIYFNHPRSAFNDLDRLSRTGFVADLFPQYHLVRNITRYVRFATASYGSSFLRVMGITTGNLGRETETSHHYEHHSFSTHTQLPSSTILLSSFVDSQGGTDSTGNTNTGIPMVHFVSLDHDSKAVVLTCRGTLGFEDVLTDMTCDYDDMMYCGKAYIVHKGIHASARRLLNGGGGKVMSVIRTALNEFPQYGLVLCGHSLGGAVSALLAVMISEPNTTSTAFYTTSFTPHNTNNSDAMPNQLPKGRRVHVYAYGPPATMSPSLRMATRGLVTTIVNGQDLIPYLSLGLLHDLQATALAFKTDDTGAKSEVTKRLWHGITGKFSDTWYHRQRMVNDEDDQWAYSTLKTLRACMLSTKLVPPGEVFVVEAIPVLQKDGFIKGPLGSPATRVVVEYVKDVEKHFGEIQFGRSMLLDHNPGRYELSLNALGDGVLRN